MLQVELLSTHREFPRYFTARLSSPCTRRNNANNWNLEKTPELVPLTQNLSSINLCLISPSRESPYINNVAQTLFIKSYQLLPVTTPHYLKLAIWTGNWGPGKQQRKREPRPGTRSWATVRWTLRGGSGWWKSGWGSTMWAHRYAGPYGKPSSRPRRRCGLQCHRAVLFWSLPSNSPATQRGGGVNGFSKILRRIFGKHSVVEKFSKTHADRFKNIHFVKTNQTFQVFQVSEA